MLSIEEINKLQKENEQLQKENKILQNRNQQLDGTTTKARCYEQALDEIAEIVSGNYETLDPLAKQQIQNILNKAKGEEDEDT